MLVISLQSGSNGNCVYVECGDVRLLFDAGISGSQAASRLAGCGHDISRVDALIISHDHADHARCAGVFHRKFGLPIYASGQALKAAHHNCSLGLINEVHHFTPGDTLRIGDTVIETYPTPHDAKDGAVFVIEHDGVRFGLLTDLGHVFNVLPEIVASLDGVMLESNYDPEMLENGPYPPFLRKRIKGPGGHLSNIESATLLGNSANRRLRWACLAHLSEQNNTPTLALKTHKKFYDRHPLIAASRYQPTPLPKL